MDIYAPIEQIESFHPLRPVAPVEGRRQGQVLKVERDLSTVGNIL
jgi:hypothetical protein